MSMVIAIVGMPGAGKSELSNIFIKHAFKNVHFGDVMNHTPEHPEIRNIRHHYRSGDGNLSEEFFLPNQPATAL